MTTKTIELTKPIILASNEDRIEKGEKLQDAEISVGVLPTDIHKENPVFYPYRSGRIYNPDDFKPIGKGNVLPQKLRESFYGLLNEARKNLPLYREALVQSKKEGTGDNKQIEDMFKTLREKENIIEEQKQRLSILESNKEVEELKKALEARNKELEALKHKNEPIRHEMFDEILLLITEEEAVYLYGPAGTGKSHLAEQVAQEAGLDFYPASTITQEFKLTGYKDGNGLFHDTNFYKAMKNGGLFFLDELDSCHSDVLVGLNGALANGYFDFPNGTIRAHKDFRVIAAGNTIGRGAQDGYTGRQELDISTLDRFLAIEIDYDKRIDLAVSGNDEELVSFAHAIREASKKTEIVILMSYRALSKVSKLANKLNFDLKKAIKYSVIKGMAQDDIQMLARNMNIDSTNKYYKAFKQAV